MLPKAVTSPQEEKRTDNEIILRNIRLGNLHLRTSQSVRRQQKRSPEDNESALRSRSKDQNDRRGSIERVIGESDDKETDRS